MSTPGPLLLAEEGPDAVLAAFCAAFEAGRPVAVLDPAWPQALRAQAGEAVTAAARAGRLAHGEAALFTSGSTGRPRGVLRTHASWRASAAALAELMDVRDDDVAWVPGRPASTLSLHGAWHARLRGLPVVGLGRGGAAPPPQATVLHAVPAALAGALTAAEAGALPRMRCAVVAGDALPPALRARALRLGWRLVEYYGAAELSFVAARVDSPGAPSTAMTAFPGADLRIGESGGGESGGGLLWVSSPYLSRGYLDPDPGAPLRLQRGRDGRLWASVGDRARLDAAGRLHVLGRGGAAVTTGGHTVVAADVEVVLLAVPGVEAAVVVGTAHPGLGQVVTAVVAGDATRAGLRARLVAACRALPAAARPRRWLLLPALPLTAAGKVDRDAARELAQERVEADGRGAAGP
ncbi:acyl-CoA synthetase (AMP-forming)/AMP-acid ligase II [Kineococcus xinjiangensis]|uniref:Acyl-CoA synthetase (AMP-forming)/AMP-acid ligase II n=1 Tax=Kineococcus xinjiangensis TaxID=512762 RepID=A0A2S6IPI7_9ACTN|nr:AMP-binding protein [Kineococcus xinjiangensis]PPK96167.1 acyl-CoA synthetase (AMP-forming)/AMP-acid ligase II [Kineococcus xinjiangensis]